MFPRRVTKYTLSSKTKILMDAQQRIYPTEILFEDQVILSDGRSKPYGVLLQLTSESLIIQPQELPLNNQDVQMIASRNVTIVRHPTTRSLGFWIKGGSDTGK